MSISANFLPEFDGEMASTRRTLERIPEDKLGWRPHEKSMLLGRLAGHIAELPGMGVLVMKDDALDFAKRPAGELGSKPTVAESQKHAVELLDKHVAALRPLHQPPARQARCPPCQGGEPVPLVRGPKAYPKSQDGTRMTGARHCLVHAAGLLGRQGGIRGRARAGACVVPPCVES